MELIEVIAGKLHGIKITESALNYHGSVTIDEDIIRAVGFLPLEFVHIWNKNSGSRISTYVLPGIKGSGQVCINGAAARSCQVGDEVIISSWRNVSTDKVWGMRPKILTFRHEKRVNTIDEVLIYDLEQDNDSWKFEIKSEK